MKSKPKKNPESEESVKAYHPRYNDVKSDVEGSYTGLPEEDQKPTQDADDL